MKQDTHPNQGEAGERRVVNLLSKLDPATYRSFHDLILPARDGTTQIDHVVVSRSGVFVIETKSHRGVICSRPQDPYWYQVLQHRRWPFQNPLWQNRRHVGALYQALQIPWNHFVPIVVFVGRCDFGSPRPAGVVQNFGLINFIQRHQTPLLSQKETMAMTRTLESLANSGLTLEDHLHSLRWRLLARRLPWRPFHQLNQAA